MNRVVPITIVAMLSLAILHAAQRAWQNSSLGGKQGITAPDLPAGSALRNMAESSRLDKINGDRTALALEGVTKVSGPSWSQERDVLAGALSLIAKHTRGDSEGDVDPSIPQVMDGLEVSNVSRRRDDSPRRESSETALSPELEHGHWPGNTTVLLNAVGVNPAATSSDISAAASTNNSTGATMFTESGVVIEIPVGVALQDVSVQALGESPADSDGLVGVGLAFEFGPPGSLFRSPLKISFPFSTQDLQSAGVTGVEDLRVLYFDSQKGVWSEEGIRIVGTDATNSKIVAEISHFTIFKIFAPKHGKRDEKHKPPPSKKEPTQKGLLEYLNVVLVALPDRFPGLFKQTWLLGNVPYGETHVATLEGNALALLALTGPQYERYQYAARRIADGFLYLQDHDPVGDGRLRNTYDLSSLHRGLSVGGSIANAESGLRDLALSLIALVQAAKKTGETRYQESAVALGSYLRSYRDPHASGFFEHGEESLIPEESPAKHTVDNLLAYVAFLRLYELTLQPQWWEAALWAKDFVETQWNGSYYLGGEPSLLSTTDEWRLKVEDPNTWSLLALDKKDRAEQILYWCEQKLSATSPSGANGMDANLDRDGVVTQATLRYALSLLILEKDAGSYLNHLPMGESRSDEEGELFPLDCAPTGITLNADDLGRGAEDLSSAVWRFAAVNRWNLLWGEPLDKPVPGEGTVAPFIRLDEPQMDQVFRAPVVQVRGRAFPRDMAITVNGFGTRREGDDFILDRFILSSKGLNTISAVATAEDGRKVMDEVKVSYEPRPVTIPKIRFREGPVTNKALVEVLLEAQGAREMRIGEDLQNAFWEPYHSIKAYVLSRGDGWKTVFAEFRNEFREQSSVVSASIALDTQPPQNGSFRVKEGRYITNPNIHLIFESVDAAFFQVGNDGVTTDWLPLEPEFSLTLSPGDGKKTVTVQFRDAAGNVSSSQSQTLYLRETMSELPARTRWISLSANPPIIGKSLEVRAEVSIPIASGIPLKEAMCILFIDQGSDQEFPMQALDGAFDSNSEEVLVVVPARMIGPSGYKKIGVKASDAFGQWGERMDIKLNPTPMDIMERVRINYMRLEDIRARLESEVRFPDGTANASTRLFLVKRPDKMKTVSANGEEIAIVRGSVLTIKELGEEAMSMDMNEGSNTPISAMDWCFNLKDEDDGKINNNGFLDHHELRFKADADNQDPDTYTIEAIPKDLSQVDYHSILFIVDYAKGIEKEVRHVFDKTIYSRLVHEKMEWVGDVTWFGTQDVKTVPLGDIGELKTTERYEDVRVNTGIPDSEFEI
jgi:outer membrane lipoprotein-sorting protein